MKVCLDVLTTAIPSQVLIVSIRVMCNLDIPHS